MNVVLIQQAKGRILLIGDKKINQNRNGPRNCEGCF